MLDDPSIVEVIADYIKTENFARAFEIYVDKEAPVLAKLAKSIGDVSYEYCRAILGKAAQTSGWLWRQSDISKEIDDMICEYEVISLARTLHGFADYTQYKSVFEALKTAVMQTNHLPKSMIESSYPTLYNFILALQTSSAAKDIKAALTQSADIINELFFSATKTQSLKILKTRLDDVVLQDSELIGLLSGISGGFWLDEDTFLVTINAKIEEHAKQSVALNLKTEWERLSGVKTPSEWAINNGIPARFIFGEFPHAEDLLKAIEQPETFAATKLAELLENLIEASVQPIVECQKLFMSETIPHKYIKFNISLSSLLEFLQDEYGKQPNNWPFNLNISAFIHKQYKGTFAPQIAEKIRNKSAEELKQKVLKLAQEDEDLGLLFWEG